MGGHEEPKRIRQEEEGEKDRRAGGKEQIRGGTGLTFNFKSRKMILGREASQWQLGQATPSSSSKGVTQEEPKRKAKSDHFRKPSSIAQSQGSRSQERAFDRAFGYGSLKQMKKSSDEKVVNLEQKIEDCQKEVDEGKHRLRDLANIKQTDMEAVDKIKRVLEKLQKEKMLLEEKLMARSDLVTNSCLDLYWINILNVSSR